MVGYVNLKGVTPKGEAEPIGGLSGIDEAPDGGIYLLSDSGVLYSGELSIGLNRNLTLGDVEKMSLRWMTGNPIYPGVVDTEGLALSETGDLYLSVEALHELWRVEPTGRILRLQTAARLAEITQNGSLEALAIDGDGTLYTLPEAVAYREPNHPVFRLHDRQWQPVLDLPKRGRFKPVGADFGPDGRFYLLERELSGVLGFRSRVRSFVVGDDALSDERVELVTPIAFHDNLEGLSVYEDADGAIHLMMVSDDNYLFFLRSEIVDYRLAAS